MGLVFVCWNCGGGWSGPHERAALRCPRCALPLACIGDVPGVNRPAPTAYAPPVAPQQGPMLALMPPPAPGPAPLPFGARDLRAARAGLRQNDQTVFYASNLRGVPVLTQPRPGQAEVAHGVDALNSVAPPNLAATELRVSPHGHQQPFRVYFSNSFGVARVRLAERASYLLALPEELCPLLLPLGVERLCALVDRLAPSVGEQLTEAFFRELLVTLLRGAGPLAPMRLPALFDLLMTGAGALGPKDVRKLLRRLIEGTLTAKDKALGGADADALLTRCLPTLTPTLMVELTEKADAPLSAAVSPRYLRRCCAPTLNLPAIGFAMPTAPTALPTRLHQLITINAVPVAELRHVLVACGAVDLPEACCLFLFDIFPDIAATVSMPRHKRLAKFVTDGAAILGGNITWTSIFSALRRLHFSGRFAGGPLLPAGSGGGREITVNRTISGTACALNVNVERFNYFANAHTYRCFNATDRLAKLAANASNEFFSDPTTDRAGLVVLLQNLLTNGAIAALCDDAATNGQGYAEGAVGGYEIGLRHFGRSYGRDQYDVTHFCALGEDRVPRKVIELLKLLL